jgi:type II secretory pathway component PulF
MLTTGEMTGSIDTQLDKVADFMEQDAETAIKQAVVVLGILVFLGVAVKVGIQIVSFYTGFYGGMEDAAEKAMN